MGVSCCHALDVAGVAARTVLAVALILAPSVLEELGEAVCAPALIETAAKLQPMTTVRKVLSSEQRPVRSSVILARGTAIEFQKLGKTRIGVGVRR